jgi:hypothetical protein
MHSDGWEGRRFEVRTCDVRVLDGEVACPYAGGGCVDVETCYRCSRLRAFHDDGSQTWVVCATPLFRSGRRREIALERPRRSSP